MNNTSYNKLNKKQDFKYKCINCNNKMYKGLKLTNYNANPYYRSYECTCGLFMDVNIEDRKIINTFRLY